MGIRRPEEHLSFTLATTPAEEEILHRPPIPGQTDTVDVHILTQHIETSVTLLDPLDQRDFYFLDLYEPTKPIRMEEDIPIYCPGPQPDGVSDYGLINDVGQQGTRLRLRDEMALRMEFDTEHYPRPEDRTATCELRAHLVQYTSQYDRFLAIDYDPISGESGSNVDGGIGLFTGIVVRDTTILFSLQVPR